MSVFAPFLRSFVAKRPLFPEFHEGPPMKTMSRSAISAVFSSKKGVFYSKTPFSSSKTAEMTLFWTPCDASGRDLKTPLGPLTITTEMSVKPPFPPLGSGSRGLWEVLERGNPIRCRRRSPTAVPQAGIPRMYPDSSTPGTVPVPVYCAVVPWYTCRGTVPDTSSGRLG